MFRSDLHDQIRALIGTRSVDMDLSVSVEALQDQDYPAYLALLEAIRDTEDQFFDNRRSEGWVASWTERGNKLFNWRIELSAPARILIWQPHETPLASRKTTPPLNPDPIDRG